MSAEFTFPTNLDPIVFWMASPSDTEAHPMLVLRAGDSSLEGLVYYTNGEGAPPEYKSGVRHVADPWLEDPVNREGSHWDESGVFCEMPSTLARKRQIAGLEAACAARDELLHLIIEKLNANKGKDEEAIPDLREVVARIAAEREPERPRRGRRPAGPGTKEPTAPAKGVNLSALMGG